MSTGFLRARHFITCLLGYKRDEGNVWECNIFAQEAWRFGWSLWLRNCNFLGHIQELWKEIRKENKKPKTQQMYDEIKVVYFYMFTHLWTSTNSLKSSFLDLIQICAMCNKKKLSYILIQVTSLFLSEMERNFMFLFQIRIIVTVFYVRAQRDLQWFPAPLRGHPACWGHPARPARAPPPSAAPAALSYPNVSSADAGRSVRTTQKSVTMYKLSLECVFAMWSRRKQNYLDAVWTGVLGDLLRHRVLQLPGQVRLLGVRALL